MGETCRSIICFFCKLRPEDWIAICGILINAFLAFWIIRTIQNRLTNKRVLKDHFINEVKELREEYRLCLNNLYADKTNPKQVLPWFKLMAIKTRDLSIFLDSKYNFNTKKLNSYHNELRELVTNNHDFMESYKKEEKVIFSHESKQLLIKFQQENNKIFNEVIILINDAE